MGLAAKGIAPTTKPMKLRGILVGIFGLLLIPSCSPPAHTIEKTTGFDQVQTGWAVDDVDALLGPPFLIKTLKDGKDYREWTVKDESSQAWRLFITSVNHRVVHHGKAKVNGIDRRTSLDQVEAGMSLKDVEKILGPGKRQEVEGKQQLNWNRRVDGQDWLIWVSFQDGRVQGKGTSQQKPKD